MSPVTDCKSKLNLLTLSVINNIKCCQFKLAPDILAMAWVSWN